MPAVQVYANGETVAWDQQAGPGGDEPEKPAPTINASPADESSSADTLARWLGGLGLLAGAIGVGVGVTVGAGGFTGGVIASGVMHDSVVKKM